MAMAMAISVLSKAIAEGAKLLHKNTRYVEISKISGIKTAWNGD